MFSKRTVDITLGRRIWENSSAPKVSIVSNVHFKFSQVRMEKGRESYKSRNKVHGGMSCGAPNPLGGEPLMQGNFITAQQDIGFPIN